MNKRTGYAVFENSGEDLYFENVAIPDLKEGEILIRNNYCTLCRSDVNTFIGKRREKTPTILGHEIIGIIEGLGPDAPQTDLRGHELKIGDRLTWAIYASHPESYYSLKGMPQKAEGLFKYGHEQITKENNLHGGLSEYTILRKNTPVVFIANDVPDPVAALLNCSVATVAGAIRMVENLDGKTVLISGTGMLGIIACAMAKKGKAALVIASDSDIIRATTARSFGADLAIQSDICDHMRQSLNKIKPESTIKIDVVLEFSGVPEAMENTLQMLDIGGSAVWIGATFPQRDLKINAEYVIRNLLSVKGLHNYNEHDFLQGISFIEHHHSSFDFKSLVYDGFPLHKVNEAFRYAIEENPFRVGINLTSQK
jgi:alcohol dehydrogenase